MSACKRILLADDDPNTLYVLRTCLSALGHETLDAENGTKALELFEQHQPSLVLLDVKMPDMSGIDVLKRIRKSPHRPDTPVILLTGFAEREIRLRGLEAGADEYLEKPLDVAILLARVRALLRFQDTLESLRASRDEVKSRNEELESLQHEQRELIDLIVHDFKGPLTAISANAEWLCDYFGVHDSEVLCAAQDILDGNRRLRDMISELLLTSQLEHGAFHLNVTSIPIVELLRSVMQRFKAAASQRGIELIPPLPSELCIAADAALLQRLFENLIDNSLRYTPHGGRVAANVRGDQDLTFEIANTGPPISPQDRERIFEKFNRNKGDSSLKHSGLGLYFCRRVAEAHGGDIRVVETTDYPTCFRMHLPSNQLRELVPFSSTLPVTRERGAWQDSTESSENAFQRADLRILRRR